MLTNLTIDNFKGIRSASIDLRDVTLLFGANSAGKSSIIQALHYAYEVFVNHNLDPDVSSIGGDFVNFGGLRNLLPYRDEKEFVSIGIRAADVKLPADLTNDLWRSECMSIWLDDKPCSELFPTPKDSECVFDALRNWIRQTNLITSFKVEFVVGIDPGAPKPEGLGGRAYAYEYVLFVNDEYFFTIGNFNEEPDCCLSQINFDHELLMLLPTSNSDWIREVRNEIGDTVLYWEEGMQSMPCGNRGQAYPFVLEKIVVDKTSEPRERSSFEIEAYNLLILVVEFFWRFSYQLMQGELEKLRYVGPIRSSYKTNEDSGRTELASRWASGLAAWDTLEVLCQLGNKEARDAMIAINSWLCDPERLNTGLHVQGLDLRRFPTSGSTYLVEDFEFEDSDILRWFYSMPSRRVLHLHDIERELWLRPCDVGIGVSQLIPVVVAAFADSRMLNIIEQPELHTHPKLQMALADMFLSASVNTGSQFILETHSEYLMLRLLRRIRETTSGKLPDYLQPVSPDRISVVFVEKAEGSTTAKQMPIDINGEFVEPWPDDFFDLDFNERFA
ncbi:MAG: DUF3696 domain-containing protein [Pirellulaceae bacterium]|nr:DUF3696 domain-containing protein [Pirellulaceae bacterium]